MKHFMYLSITTLAVLLLGSVESAQAQGYIGGNSCLSGYGRFGGFGGFGFLSPSSPYAMGRIPTPPYFAIHPPVYYSQSVPRTYGYSPFAYPGTMVTPEVATATAQVIDNPYVPTPASSTKFDRSLTKHEPKEILNPYVATTRMVSQKDVH